MKYEARSATVISNIDPNETRQFSFKNSSKLFSILSDGLYSDKYGSVVRELSSNAYDSHIEAGKADVPFEITLPTSLNQEFRIVDYGTGLSEEDVFEIFTCYGESTKTDSNDFIGAFGLGSKSPFSLVKNFSVISKHDGLETVYLMYIDEEGCPRATKISSVPVPADDTGLTISFSVPATDFRKFQNSLKQLMYFQMPVLVDTFPLEHHIRMGYKEDGSFEGFEGHEILHAGKDFVVYDKVDARNDYWYGSNKNLPHTIRIIMGQIYFDLKPDNLPEEFHYIFSKFAQHNALIVKCNIGDIEPTPSREMISFTKKTIKFLEQKFGEIAESFDKAIYEEIFELSKSSVWDASILMNRKYPFYDFSSNQFLNDLKNKAFEIDALNYPTLNIYVCAEERSYGYRRTVKKWNKIEDHDTPVIIQPSKFYNFFYSKDVKSAYSINQAKSEINNGGNGVYNVFITPKVKKTSSNAQYARELRKLFNFLGNPIEKKKLLEKEVVESVRKPREPREIYKDLFTFSKYVVENNISSRRMYNDISKFRSSILAAVPSEEIFDKLRENKTGIYYFCINSFLEEMKKATFHVSSYNTFIDIMNKIQAVFPEYLFVFINGAEKRVESLEENYGAQSGIELLRNFLEENLSEFLNASTRERYVQELKSSKIPSIFLKKSVISKFNDSNIKKFLEDLTSYVKTDSMSGDKYALFNKSSKSNLSEDEIARIRDQKNKDIAQLDFMSVFKDPDSWDFRNLSEKEKEAVYEKYANMMNLYIASNDKMFTIKF